MLRVQGYATHAIFDDYDSRCFMFMDYITYYGVVEHVAEQMMLQDLERKFHRSQTSMAKIGFPTPQGVPTELEEAMSHWKNDDIKTRQGHLLENFNYTHPNNHRQQMGFDSIMESILNFNKANRDDITQHKFHSICFIQDFMLHAANMVFLQLFAPNQVLLL